MSITQLSQRNKKWKDIKLGWSDNTTIGSHGCLVTCLAMFWNSTPNIVNEWLKNNNGFINLNLVWWEHLPGFIWRGWTYKNDKVLETIDKYGACIVETDFNTNPKDGSHFVLFTGNKKLYDPWDRKEKATSSFPVYYGYAIIDPSKNPIKEGSMECLLYNNEIDKKTFEELVTKSSKYDEFNKAGYPFVAEVNELVSGLRKSIDDKNKELATAKETADQYRKTFNVLVADIASALGCRQDAVEIVTFAQEAGTKADELEDLQTAFAKLKNSSETTESELRAEIARLEALLKQENVLENAASHDLIKELLRRLLGILDLMKK